MRDHPRMRGEDHVPVRVQGDIRGSPPHARGRRCRLLLERPLKRITPACAGKTPWVCIPWSWETDHPRMRGEDNQPPIEKLAKSGSPPHARGRRFADPAANLPSGITPACAGKTVWSIVLRVMYPDHPRMRGEDFLHSRNRKRGKGSPPHARGRQPMTSALRLRWGITPACAGKTPTPTNPTQPSPDHPRMRGEDPTTIPVWLSPAGSPPHARGRQLGRDLGSVGARITPACAGKTAQRVYREIEASDHPRMRGEDSRSTGPCWCGGGSPPHARGRRRRADFQPAIRRITPACAGKTSQAQGLG